MPTLELPPLDPPAVGETWERVRAAAVDIVLERGYPDASAAAIADRAGVDRTAFESRFAGKEDCCVKVYEAHLAEFDQRLLAAFGAEPAWRDGLRAAAYAALAYIRDNQRAAKYDLIVLGEGGESFHLVRDRYMQRAVELVDAGRHEPQAPDDLSRAAAEGVLGAIYIFLTRMLAAEADTSEAAQSVPQLMYVAVRPYLGHEAAREELQIPPPRQFGAKQSRT